MCYSNYIILWTSVFYHIIFLYVIYFTVITTQSIVYVENCKWLPFHFRCSLSVPCCWQLHLSLFQLPYITVAFISCTLVVYVEVSVNLLLRIMFVFLLLENSSSVPYVLCIIIHVPVSYLRVILMKDAFMSHCCVNLLLLRMVSAFLLESF